MRFNPSVFSAQDESSRSSPFPSSALFMDQDSRNQIASLHREVILLQNELNFEIFLKQQYLQVYFI